MTGPPPRTASSNATRPRSGALQPIDVVVVGAASRDLAPDDPRGWRLGGPVSFASLILARLGLRVAAIIGLDRAAEAADELHLLRESGVMLQVTPLGHGPVFENQEGPRGRTQVALDISDPIPIEAARPFAGAAPGVRGLFLAPVAGELGDAWGTAVPAASFTALGWQGMLRSFDTDGRVTRRPPVASPLLDRAGLVGVSRDDLASETSLAALGALIASHASLVLTHGADGGMIMGAGRDGGSRPVVAYPSIRSDAIVDPTGAGDTFLAALFAARLEPRLVGGRLVGGFDVLLAAAAASLVVEGRGLSGVPTRAAIRHRIRRGLVASGHGP